MNDEFDGIGGAYVIDDATQTRKRVSGTPLAPAQPEPPADPAPHVPAEE